MEFCPSTRREASRRKNASASKLGGSLAEHYLDRKKNAFIGHSKSKNGAIISVEHRRTAGIRFSYLSSKK
jgi:hypothetical protein